MMGSAPLKEEEETKALSLLCEDTVERWPYGRVPHQEPNHAGTPTWDLQPPELKSVSVGYVR